MSEQQIAEDTSSASTHTFLSSLIFNSALGGGLFLAFSILRPRDKNVYSPRTYMIAPEKRPPALSKHPLAWIKAAIMTKDEDILRWCGLDAYVFLSYIRSCFLLFATFSVLACVILVPININAGGKAEGIIQLAIANVPVGSRLRWAHILLTILFTWITIYRTISDLYKYILLRHDYLSRPEHASSAQANTILVMGIPPKVRSVDQLYRLFKGFPGGVRRIFLNRKVGHLLLDTERRDFLVAKLESLLTSYILDARKLSRKAIHSKSASKQRTLTRPVMRRSWLMACSAKVDAIDYLSGQIVALCQKIAEQQTSEDSFETLSSGFIMFNRQISAHMACQIVIHETPLAMSTRFLEVNPRDIIWGNLDLNPYERYIRKAVSVGLTIALVVLWAIPSGVVSTISSVATLRKIDAFSWLNSLPDWLLGVIQGVLPPLMMAMLMMLLPRILRMLAVFEGKVRKSDVELSLIHRYFFFLFVQMFLVQTLVGGLAKAASSIYGNPGHLPLMLAEKMPGISLYFISFVLLRAFSSSSKEIVQIFPLIVRRLRTQLFPDCPRKILSTTRMPQFEWGVSFADHSLIFVIGLSYSTINPTMLLFVTLYYGIFYVVYRYQFLYVYADDIFATGGLAFPRAVRHIFVGLYVFQLVFTGLMILDRAVAQEGASTARIVLIVLSLIGTIIADLYISHVFSQLVTFMPLNLSIGKKGLSNERDLFVGNQLHQQSESNANDNANDNDNDNANANINININMNMNDSTIANSNASSSNPDEIATSETSPEPSVTASHKNSIMRKTTLKRMVSAPINVIKTTSQVTSSTVTATTKAGINIAKGQLDRAHRTARNAIAPTAVRLGMLIGTANNGDLTNSPVREYSSSGTLRRKVETDDPEIYDAYTHPSIRAPPVAYIWLPPDDTGYTDADIDRMVRDAKGWICVVRTGSRITSTGRVVVEIDKPPEPQSYWDAPQQA